MNWKIIVIGLVLVGVAVYFGAEIYVALSSFLWAAVYDFRYLWFFLGLMVFFVVLKPKPVVN